MNNERIDENTKALDKENPIQIFQPILISGSSLS